MGVNTILRVMRYTKTTGMAQLMLLRIADHVNEKDGYTFVSLATLGREIGAGRRHSARLRQELIDSRELHVQHMEGRSSRQYVTTTEPHGVSHPCSTEHDPHDPQSMTPMTHRAPYPRREPGNKKKREDASPASLRESGSSPILPPPPALASRGGGDDQEKKEKRPATTPTQTPLQRDAEKEKTPTPLNPPAPVAASAWWESPDLKDNQAFLKALKEHPDYRHVNVEDEIRRSQEFKSKKPGGSWSKAWFMNHWMNRIEKPPELPPEK